tara:strand:+ start:716 stop:1534 length:819 start_codon:yes stop_codon:yes gene_type:complete
MELSEKQLAKLRETIYGGYNRSPLMTRGNKATGGSDRFHRNAGQIDYYTYGGEASRDYNDRNYARTRDSKHYKENRKSYGDYFKSYEKRNKQRDTWKGIADHLGIDKVEDEKDLRKMYDYVMNYKASDKEDDKPDYTPTELPEDPYAGGGDPPKGPTGGGGMPKPGDFGTNRPPGSIPYIPPSSDEGRAAYGTAGSGGKTSLDTAIESVADYGNRATDDYFGRFMPEMGLRNKNESQATGRALLSSIQAFTGKVPELGDPKDLFKYYLGKID